MTTTNKTQINTWMYTNYLNYVFFQWLPYTNPNPSNHLFVNFAFNVKMVKIYFGTNFQNLVCDVDQVIFFFSLFCSDRICNVRLIQLRCANKLILSCKKYDTINNIGNNTGIKSEHIKRVWWKMLRRKVCDACACNGGPLCDDTNKSMAEYRSKIKTEETKTKVNHYCNWLRMVWRVWRRCRMKNTHLRAFYRFSSL